MNIDLTPEEIEFVRGNAETLKIASEAVIGREGDRELPNEKKLGKARENRRLALGLLDKLSRE